VIGLPGEEERCLAKYLLLLEQDLVLSAQAPELIPLLGRESFGFALASAR
jgi:hypothetical protein